MRDEDCFQPAKLGELPNRDLILKSNDGSVTLFDRKTKRRKAYNPLGSVYLNPSSPPISLSKDLVAVETNSDVFILDAKTLQTKCVIQFSGQFRSNGSTGLTLLPNGYLLISSRYGHKLLVVDPNTGIVVAQVWLDFGPKDVIYNPILRLLVIVDEGGRISFYGIDYAGMSS